MAYTAARIGIRAASRHYGIPPGTISKRVKKANLIGLHPIPTHSSRPKRHPRQLSDEAVCRIIATRHLLRRSAEVIHRALADTGLRVSLSSVKRTLDRQGLLRKRSPWKRYHAPSLRPLPDHPGALVQADTIHIAVQGRTVLYVFTLIDVYSRWAYARAAMRANARMGLEFVRQAQVAAPFLFRCIQTDHGSEWSAHFTERISIRHRHSRARQSNDNAHIERFNRTLREECLDAVPAGVRTINHVLPAYLGHYNERRHHFGLDLLSPAQFLSKCFQAIE